MTSSQSSNANDLAYGVPTFLAKAAMPNLVDEFQFGVQPNLQFMDFCPPIVVLCYCGWKAQGYGRVQGMSEMNCLQGGN